MSVGSFKLQNGGRLDVDKERDDKDIDKAASIDVSEVTVDEIKEAFLEFDIDSDGTITSRVTFQMTILTISQYAHRS